MFQKVRLTRLYESMFGYRETKVLSKLMNLRLHMLLLCLDVCNEIHLNVGTKVILFTHIRDDI